MSDPILDNLNPPQREAVETIHGPLLILAGAGSGKTRVVTRRIAHIMRSGARPWEVLAITFTNKAAGEMKRRVEDLVGQSGAWISTFHSFCARVLRREAEALGYPHDFTIYDDEDSMSIIKEILKRIGADSEDKKFSARSVRQEISGFKNKAMSPDEVPGSMYHERLIQKIYAEYEAELKKNAAFDFDDLLSQTVRLFKTQPEVLSRYQSRFRYVLVDEYQDTNACQYGLIKMLGAVHRNVCATGDPDQSIYGWRGADVRNILSFERDFPDAKIVKLEQNYRSTKRILAAADAVIANNKERKPKTLWTENDDGVAITLRTLEDEVMEGYNVARQIDEHVKLGKRFSDIAVFYRTNAQSRPIEAALVQSAIPYQLIGGTAFYERREIKDALAYLRLAVNPKDDMAFRRIINVPKRSLGDSAVEQIEIEANRRQCSLLETLYEGGEGSSGHEVETFIAGFKPKPRQGLIAFAKLMDKLRSMPQYPVADVMREMLERSGLRNTLIESGESERVENIDQLMNAAVEFDKENDPANVRVPEGPPPEPGAYDGAEELAQRNASVAGFLENSALLAATDNLDTDADRVTLMTLHMAKGLEYPIAFITGLEEGLLPLVKSGGWGNFGQPVEEDPAAIEEERRLMYVGITRAMEKLYLTQTKFRMKFGRTDSAVPSRFLAEIPVHLFDGEVARGKKHSENGKGGWSIGEPVKEPTDFPFDFDPDEDEDENAKHGLEAHATKASDPFAEFEQEASQKFGEAIAPKWKRPVLPRSKLRSDAALEHVVDQIFGDEAAQDDPNSFEVGDRVKHEQFGDGIVDGVIGTGLSTKLKINFRRVGPKLLLVSMAASKLKKV